MYKISKKQAVATRQESASPTFRKILVSELGTVCVNCGSDQFIEYHHIVPIVYGGTNKLSNIVPLCSDCHARAHQKVSGEGMAKARREGRIGRKYITPYEDAIPTLKRFYNMEIGNKEMTALLGYKSNRSTLYDYRRRYEREFNVPKDFYNNIDLLAAQEHRVQMYKQNKLKDI